MKNIRLSYQSKNEFQNHNYNTLISKELKDTRSQLEKQMLWHTFNRKMNKNGNVKINIVSWSQIVAENKIKARIIKI